MAKPYAGPTSSELHPDTDTMWRWLSWWFHVCNRGLVEIGWMNPTTGGLTQFRRFELEDEAILAFAEEVNSVGGQSIYVRAATIAGDSPSGRTTDLHVMQAGGIWADLDTEQQVKDAQQVSSILRANGWVTTGKHPHPRYQLYFRTSEPLTNPETIRSFNRRLLSLYGGDPAVVNPSRLMRLPGTIAWPYKEGRIPELTFFDEGTDGRPKVYPIPTLASQLPAEDMPYASQQNAPQAAAPSSSSPGTLSSLGTLDTASGLLNEIRAGRQWHNNMVRLVGHWISRGWSNVEILAAAEAFTIPPYTHAQTLAEVRKAIEGGRQKWSVPDAEPFLDDAAGREEQSAGQGRKAILSLDDLEELQDPDWLLQGIIPEQALVVPYGPPKSGKSFLLLSMGLHIAAGLPWFGRSVKYGAVVYIAGEGVGGLKHRVRAMLQAYEIQPLIPFWIIPRAVNFRMATEVKALAGLIRDTVKASLFSDVPIALVIIDTLARAMPGADENSAQEVGLVIAATDWLKGELACAAAIVHHEGKDEGRGARGTSALRGAWDAAFRISNGNGPTTLEVVDQKDAEAGAVLKFEMREITTGIGRSSLVPWLLDHETGTEGQEGQKGTRSPTGRTKQAFDILADLIDSDAGAILPPLSELPRGVRGVPVNHWRAAFYASQADLEYDARKKAFQRATQALVATDLIRMHDPWVWLCRSV